MTFWLTAVRAWVAVASLTTRCKANVHNKTSTRLLALRRLVMTWQVCSSQIFTLYYLTKCTYYMSSCSLKYTDRGILAVLLSLVSSIYLFNPPLRVLSGGKNIVKPFNHTFNRFLVQIQVVKLKQQIQALSRIGASQISFEESGITNQTVIFVIC